MSGANAYQLSREAGALHDELLFQKEDPKKVYMAEPRWRTKNEIDFILTDKRHIFRNVSVINRFNTGSDHLMVRGSLNINIRLDRARLVTSTLRSS